MVTMGEFYTVDDNIPKITQKILNLDDTCTVHAKWTGEYHAPKRGEWYLSGADIAAYLAREDMYSQYYIAELVKTKTVTTIVEVE